MWHLEAVYNCQHSYALCFTQMHLRSNHRKDLSAALRHHIIRFTILGSIGTIQNVSSGLSMLFGHLGESTKKPPCSKEFKRIAVLGLDTKIRAQAEITDKLEVPS